MPVTMPIQADHTLAGFNCYCTYDEAVQILGARLSIDNWKGKGETDQKRALLVATAMLDQYVDWKGSVADTDQLLAWPRQNVQRRDRPSGTYWASDIIPEFLKLATAELANDLLGGDLEADQATGLTSLSVGSISLAFDKTDRKDPIPEAIVQIVSDYGTVEKQSGDRMMRVYRV